MSNAGGAAFDDNDDDDDNNNNNNNNDKEEGANIIIIVVHNVLISSPNSYRFNASLQTHTNSYNTHWMTTAHTIECQRAALSSVVSMMVG